MRLALILILLATPVAAQETRNFYDATGRETGRSQTFKNRDSTYFDAAGRVTERSQTSGGETRYYDATGRLVGTVRK
jgi:YD repeat-containing protein